LPIAVANGLSRYVSATKWHQNLGAAKANAKSADSEAQRWPSVIARTATSASANGDTV
jgi:hypothetical protein